MTQLEMSVAQCNGAPPHGWSIVSETLGQLLVSASHATVAGYVPNASHLQPFLVAISVLYLVTVGIVMPQFRDVQTIQPVTTMIPNIYHR